MQAKRYNYMKRAVRFLFHLLWMILQTGVFKILSCLGFKAQNCPFTEAFTLVVYWSTGYPGAYFSQEYTHYTGNRRAIQNYNADTAAWKKYEFQITMK